VKEQIRRRASAVAKGVALAPLYALVVVFIVMFPGAMAIAVVQWSFDTGLVALEVFVVTVLIIATFAGLWWSFAYGGIATLLRFGRFEPTLRASALAFFAVVSFTSLTALLHEEGLVGITPDPGADEALDTSFEFYLWQLANTLPLLDIPGNLDWNRPFEFDDRLGGLLVILFTGFVIFPLIQLARLILADRDVPFDVAVTRVLRKHVGSKRIFITEETVGSGCAIVDGDLLVDVMQGVWNHDAAVRRLEKLGGRARPPRGYLLVVDAVAEAARVQIALGLSQAPFAARLAVWRADQPASALTEAFDALHEQIAG
jgi:hypothetical protein